jgi:preprotein translocase subunit YajC
MDSLWILAQAGPDGADESVPGKDLSEMGVEQHSSGTIEKTDSNDLETGRPKGLFEGPQGFIILIGFTILMFFFVLRGPRKQKQQHKQMVSSLKKNDKVRTIGGIIGTVVDIKDDEFVLKVDESNNTKMRFSISAIGRNLSKE